MSVREITIGAMEPKLCEQLKGLLPSEELERLDRFSSGITLLHLHSILTDRESDSARRRLMARIKKSVNKRRK